MIKLALLFLLFSLVNGCASDRIIAPFAEDAPLPSASPASVGMDSTLLNLMLAQIPSEKEHDLHSVLVFRNDALVFETYFHNHTRHTPHDLRSATKSITSLLTGIAIEKGLFDLDTSVADLLGQQYPEAIDKDNLLVRHLLTMQTGLDCNDGNRKTKGQEDRMYRSRNWARYFLSVPAIEEPGLTTSYCTGGVVALGEILANATGQSVEAFAETHLFAPMGIKNYQWATYAKGSKIDTGGHIMLTPQAMIKLGKLILNGGMWQGNQLVSSDWIKTSTTQHVEIDNNPYGFLWWINRVKYGNKEIETITARGNGGQVIFIVPEFALVSAFTAGYYNSEKAGIPYQIFYNLILPAVDEMKPFLKDIK